MSAIMFKSTPLKDLATTALSNGSSKVIDSCTKANSLNVPSDFTYKDYLNHLPENLNDISFNLKELTKWLNESVDTLEATVTEIENQFTAYSCTEIKPETESAVKLY